MKNELVGWHIQITFLLTMTPRRLARLAGSAYVNQFRLRGECEKNKWLHFWLGTDRCLEMEDGEPLELDDGSGSGCVWAGVDVYSMG